MMLESSNVQITSNLDKNCSGVMEWKPDWSGLKGEEKNLSHRHRPFLLVVFLSKNKIYIPV